MDARDFVVIGLWTLHLQGDYNIVINDFEKAKSLFADTDVKVFRKGQFILFFFVVRVCVQKDY